MIHFIRPMWLYALIPALIYLAWIIYANKQQNPWEKVCDPHLLPALLEKNQSQSQKIYYTYLFLFFVITIIALAGPAWKKSHFPIYRDISSMLVVLDLSQTMQQEDIKPDRLTRAKFKIRDLINASPNTQMGLVVFSREAFVAAPLTNDANTLNALLEELDPNIMPVTGTEMAEGLNQGLALLKQASTTHSNIVLITASEPTAASWDAAKAIREAGDQLNILAMVDENSKNQHILSGLQRLANIGNGTLYSFSADGSDIQNILRKNNTQQIVRDENVENTFLWLDGGPWLCLALIPLALILLREKGRYEKK